jgi:AraC-like DNA-binding protein
VIGREYAEHRMTAGGVELLDARFEHHVFERHIHDTYAIGVTLQGVQRFWCRGATHSSTPGHVIAIAPGEAHDGESGSQGGYAYRMFYCSAERVPRNFALTTPLIADGDLASQLHQAWRATSQSPQSLAADELLDAALATLAERYGGAHLERARAVDQIAVRRVHDRLRGSITGSISSDDLAALAGMSRFQMSRQFQRAYGLPPHAFHLHVRLEEARRRLAYGNAIAAVASDLGFVDQSHLHRRFKGAFGISPGAWRKAAQGSKTTRT